MQIEKLSDIIVNYSINVQKDENVLIMTETEKTMPLVKCLVKKIKEKGGNVVVKIANPELESLIKLSE